MITSVNSPLPMVYANYNTPAGCVNIYSFWSGFVRYHGNRSLRRALRRYRVKL